MTKNTSYHYSIIIPHKNTPRLLERCLYSIPTWDEIQIIIIDDNSNSESVDFSHFPGNGRKNTEVLFTKEGKGAGYVNPEKPYVPLNKNDAFQKVQKRRVQKKR